MKIEIVAEGERHGGPLVDGLPVPARETPPRAWRIRTIVLPANTSVRFSGTRNALRLVPMGHGQAAIDDVFGRRHSWTPNIIVTAGHDYRIKSVHEETIVEIEDGPLTDDNRVEDRDPPYWWESRGRGDEKYRLENIRFMLPLYCARQRLKSGLSIGDAFDLAIKAGVLSA